jgi:uncharacterized protein with HEPN domain
VRDDRERVKDVLEAIQRIERYASAGRERFESDELVQTWILHHIQIIGEACRGVSPEFRQLHPEIPWDGIVGMRSILVHVYFGIDQNAVWAVVVKDLPDLKKMLDRIVAEL